MHLRLPDDEPGVKRPAAAAATAVMRTHLSSTGDDKSWLSIVVHNSYPLTDVIIWTLRHSFEGQGHGTRFECVSLKI